VVVPRRLGSVTTAVRVAAGLDHAGHHQRDGGQGGHAHEPRVQASRPRDAADHRQQRARHRFAYEEPWPTPSQCDEQWVADHGPITDHDLSSVTPIATEFLIESASGGSCVLRVVSSAYGSGADWENEFFAEMVAGWGEMLDNLAAHFNEAM
jgi:hypothetical protein